MNIIIAGSGDTGTHLAKMLSEEHCDVVLMSTDSEYLENIDSSFNLMTLYGDATCVADLRRAGIAECDLFVAVTPVSDTNMVSCQLASILGAGRTIARVGCSDYLQPELAAGFESAGVGQLVYPETLVADEIVEFMRNNWVLKWYEVQGGELLLAGVRIEPGAPGSGKCLKDLHPGGRTFHVAAIRRGGELLIPRGDDCLQGGDTVYFVMRPEHADDVARLCGRSTHPVKSVMVTGTGAITRELAARLAGRCSLTIIDSDKEACRRLAEDFPKATVVCAPVHDITTQRDEGLADTDLFVALSNDPPSNIVACMMAKDAGVKKTVAQIEAIQYISEADRLGVDKTVNKKLITSGKILRIILGLGARVESVMALGDAEVADITVTEGSRITSGVVMDLRLPHQITLGGLLRGGRGCLVEGKTRILPGDRVLVFFRVGALNKVDYWFKGKD